MSRARPFSYSLATAACAIKLSSILESIRARSVCFSYFTVILMSIMIYYRFFNTSYSFLNIIAALIVLGFIFLVSSSSY